MVQQQQQLVENNITTVALIYPKQSSLKSADLSELKDKTQNSKKQKPLQQQQKERFLLNLRRRRARTNTQRRFAALLLKTISQS